MFVLNQKENAIFNVKIIPKEVLNIWTSNKLVKKCNSNIKKLE